MSTLLSMMKGSLAVLCLICMSNGRRIQASMKGFPSSASAEVHSPDGAPGRLGTFATLLVALNPTAAFRPAGLYTEGLNQAIKHAAAASRVHHIRVAQRGLALMEVHQPSFAGSSSEGEHNDAVPLGQCLTLPAALASNLTARGFNYATPIQKAALARVADRNSVILHAETGSGKTLAYLLPTMLKLSASDDNTIALILSPTRELCIQLQDEARALIRDGIDLDPKSVRLIAQGASMNIAYLGAPELCRILIAQPTELCQFLGSGGDKEAGELAEVLGNSVSTLILDEVDALIPGKKQFKGKRHMKWMDKGMHPAEAVVKLMASRAQLPEFQVLAASATLDRATRKKISKQLRRCKLLPRTLDLVSTSISAEKDEDKGKVQEGYDESQAFGASDRLTSVPSSIEHHFLKLNRNAFEDDDGVDVAATAVRDVHLTRAFSGNTLLFVSSLSTYLGGALTIYKKLRELDLDPVLLSDVLWPTSSRSQKRRVPKWRRQTLNPERAGEKASDRRANLNSQMRNSSSSRLLVADTAATRGLHLDDVSTVVVLGLPANLDQYLHLAGRTGRWPRREFPGASVAVTLATKQELKRLNGWSTTHNDVIFQPFKIAYVNDDDEWLFDEPFAGDETEDEQVNADETDPSDVEPSPVALP